MGPDCAPITIPPIGEWPDCNLDLVPDFCQITSNDCNGNLVPDECDADGNGDGIPDDCCATNADCDDANANPCMFGVCTAANTCTYTPTNYGDVVDHTMTCGPDGMIDLFDILAVLDGFQNVFTSSCELFNIDLAGPSGSCEPDGQIDLTDILAVLDAFQGTAICCTEEG